MLPWNWPEGAEGPRIGEVPNSPVPKPEPPEEEQQQSLAGSASQ